MDGECSACALSNYGVDCENISIADRSMDLLDMYMPKSQEVPEPIYFTAETSTPPIDRIIDRLLDEQSPTSIEEFLANEEPRHRPEMAKLIVIRRKLRALKCIAQ